MAVQVVTAAPRRQRPGVMPRVKEEVVVLLGAELAAPDGRPLGRLREVGLDHFGHLSALLGPRGAYAAAGIREVSRNGAAVVVDPAVPLRRTVHRRVGRDTHPVPCTRRWQLGSKPCPLLRQGGVSGPGTGG